MFNDPKGECQGKVICETSTETIAEYEARALRHPDLLCHEIHSNISSVAATDGHGGYFDRPGRVTCVDQFRFQKNERWTMLIIHYPWWSGFVKDFRMHTNFFMLFENDDLLEQERNSFPWDDSKYEFVTFGPRR